MSSSSEFSDYDLSETFESNVNITTSQRRSTRNASTFRTPSNTTGRRQKKRPMSLQQKERKLFLEQKRLMRSKKPMISRLPFSMLVREYMQECSTTVDRITQTALEALQETCEEYLTQVLTDAYLLSLHCKRVTLMLRDLQVLAVLRNIR